VSFYNESDTGAAVYPSPVVAAFGYLDDFSRVTTSAFKEPGGAIYLVGRRWGEMGASQLFNLDDAWGDTPPRPRFTDERNMMNAMLELNRSGLVQAAHDISEGGMAVAISEMLFAPYGDEYIGARLDLSYLLEKHGDISLGELLFCENGGYILEVKPENKDRVEEIMKGRKTDFYPLGEVTTEPVLALLDNGDTILSEPVEGFAQAWREGLDRIF
jgi:phosphoribosylformylglycinamidine synthase